MTDCINNVYNNTIFGNKHDTVAKVANIIHCVNWYGGHKNSTLGPMNTINIEIVQYATHTVLGNSLAYIVFV